MEDFLFEYYAYRPAKLLHWHPGIGIALREKPRVEYLCHRDYVDGPTGITADALRLSSRRIDSIRWIRQLLRRTSERSGFFGCFGLHEWAIVYDVETIRHAGLAATTDRARNRRSRRIPRLALHSLRRLSLFSPAARPLNKYQPTRDTTTALEQPGCLHANMDLYKWAFKLAPFTASELVADCFELARRVRALDMRASPYDLTSLGYTPVRIETPEGRAEFEALQREFAVCAAPLRERLVEVCEQVIEEAGVSCCLESVAANSVVR